MFLLITNLLLETTLLICRTMHTARRRKNVFRRRFFGSLAICCKRCRTIVLRRINPIVEKRESYPPGRFLPAFALFLMFFWGDRRHSFNLSPRLGLLSQQIALHYFISSASLVSNQRKTLHRPIHSLVSRK